MSGEQVREVGEVGAVQGCGEEPDAGADADKVNALRAEACRLHAERGAAVAEAKRLRMEGGFNSAAYQLEWVNIENLTTAIACVEMALEQELKRGQPKAVSLLRDPAVELPDDEVDVVIALKDNEDGVGVTTGHHMSDFGWCESAQRSPHHITLESHTIIGWCHHEEAREALLKAVRHG